MKSPRPLKYDRILMGEVMKVGGGRRWADVLDRRKNRDFMMMDYGAMAGSGVSGIVMTWAWLTYILVIILLVLAIIALWKYISQK